MMHGLMVNLLFIGAVCEWTEFLQYAVFVVSVSYNGGYDVNVDLCESYV